ncbi:MAG: hypothetical protein EOO82_02835, partial [Oxalobacteraceae bacterium]
MTVASNAAVGTTSSGKGILMNIKLNTRVSSVAMAAIIVTLGSGDAFAQTTVAEPEIAAQTTAEDSNLGDIVVTAQRRPERVQDIPLAVTAFSESTIRNLNLNDAI